MSIFRFILANFSQKYYKFVLTWRVIHSSTFIVIYEKFIKKEVPGHGQDNIGQTNQLRLKAEFIVPEPHPGNSDDIVEKVQNQVSLDFFVSLAVAFEGPELVEVKNKGQHYQLVEH